MARGSQRSMWFNYLAGTFTNWWEASIHVGVWCTKKKQLERKIFFAWSMIIIDTRRSINLLWHMKSKSIPHPKGQPAIDLMRFHTIRSQINPPTLPVAIIMKPNSNIFKPQKSVACLPRGVSSVDSNDCSPRHDRFELLFTTRCIICRQLLVSIVRHFIVLCEYMVLILLLVGWRWDGNSQHSFKC